MSEQVKRFDRGLACHAEWIYTYPNGDYVLYTDYAKLEAENAALREALKLLHENCLYQLDEDDDRVTHVRCDIYETVEAALKAAGGGK